MMRYLAAYLLSLYCSLVSTFILQDHAWYTKDIKSLERLYDYIRAAHGENIHHMSVAGLFFDNRGTKSVEVVEPLLDGCHTHFVRFKFKTDDTIWYYVMAEEVLDK